MKNQGRRDTKPELALRKALHAQGFRYRVDQPVLPKSRRRADMVFSRAKVAVFVHGCFWHGCPVHATKPKANAEWWEEKLGKNVERDAATRAELESAGWTVVQVWEHEDPLIAAGEIAAVVRERQGSVG